MRHVLGLCILIVILPACGKKAAEKAPPAPEPPVVRAIAPDAGEAAPTPAKVEAPARVRVILVSVDGWHADLVSEMPRFRTMREHGAWTLEAETPVEATTVVSHATMFTGVLSERHGVKENAPRGGPALEAWRPLRVPTLFQSLDREAARPLALLQKQKIQNLLPEDAFGEVVLDRASRESRLIGRACSDAKDPQGSRAVVIHLKRLDAIGHDVGWLTDEQRRGAAAIDLALGTLSTCLAEAQAVHGGAFALIVTADHGGHGTTHGSDRPSDRRVPWLLIGPGVKRGYEIPSRVGLEDTAAWFIHYLGDVQAGPWPEMAGRADPDLLE